MAHYTKTYSSPSQLVSLLQSRGLFIEDVARMENYLRHISYYRFSAYLYPLLTTPKENHVFKSGATFNQALDMYRFDRHLRLLMFNEIEKIEIAVRSAIIKYFLNIISPHNDMKAKINALLANYPAIDTAAMGFPRGWEDEPLWQ